MKFKRQFASFLKKETATKTVDDAIAKLKNNDVTVYTLIAKANLDRNIENLCLYLLRKDFSLSENIEFAKNILKHQPSLIYLFPKIKDLKEVKAMLLYKNPSLFKEMKEFHNKKDINNLVVRNPILYRYIPEKFKEDITIVKNALSGVIFYPEKHDDGVKGVYFDIPKKMQENIIFTKIALKEYPMLFKYLDKKTKSDNEFIKHVLMQYLNKDGVESLYYINYILPLVPDDFFISKKNVIWFFKGLSNINQLNIFIYANYLLMTFKIFLKKATKYHPDIKLFLNDLGITKKINNSLLAYNSSLFSNKKLPNEIILEEHGVTNTLNEIWSNLFPNLDKKFENFLLMIKISNELKINSTQYQIRKI